MKITETKNIIQHNDGTITLINNNQKVRLECGRTYDLAKKVYQDKTEEAFDNLWERLPEEYKKELSTIPNPNNPKSLLTNIINFFSEFDFEPNFRFINTLCYAKNKKQYIQNYFNLTNSPHVNAIAEKMQSVEFKEIIKRLDDTHPQNYINQRLKIYYGSQGTGKTTKALQETDNKCMVCHNAMLPSDIMEDFTFVEGKATFQPSAFYKAMENGQKITLDEINLLPFESLRFLQSIFDGKKEFLYKGNKVVIKDGFQVIGTMNLSINGMTFGLPEPLVDRCSQIECFKLTAEDLLSALK